MNLTVECNKHSIGLSAKIVIDENGKDVTIKVEPCPQCEEEAKESALEEEKIEASRKLQGRINRLQRQIEQIDADIRQGTIFSAKSAKRSALICENFLF